MIARYIAFYNAILTSLLTAAPRIQPTSIRCRSARQLNPAGDPLSDAGILFKGPGPPHAGSRSPNLFPTNLFEKLAGVDPRTRPGAGTTACHFCVTARISVNGELVPAHAEPSVEKECAGPAAASRARDLSSPSAVQYEGCDVVSQLARSCDYDGKTATACVRRPPGGNLRDRPHSKYCSDASSTLKVASAAALAISLPARTSCRRFLMAAYCCRSRDLKFVQP